MKVHELLADKSRWTTGYMARDAVGRACSPKSDKAVCWCMLGAIDHCYPVSEVGRIADRVRRAIIEQKISDFYSVSNMNDNHGYDTVIKLARELDI